MLVLRMIAERMQKGLLRRKKAATPELFGVAALGLACYCSGFSSLVAVG